MMARPFTQTGVLAGRLERGQSMANIIGKVEFQPVRMDSGAGWFIRVLLPEGEQPRLGGFSTEAEAADWIRHKSARWLKEHHGYRYF